MKNENAALLEKESMDMTKKSINSIQGEDNNELIDLAEMTDAWRKTTLEAIRVLAVFITDTAAFDGVISRLQTVTGDGTQVSMTLEGIKILHSSINDRDAFDTSIARLMDF